MIGLPPPIYQNGMGHMATTRSTMEHFQALLDALEALKDAPDATIPVAGILQVADGTYSKTTSMALGRAGQTIRPDSSSGSSKIFASRIAAYATVRLVGLPAASPLRRCGGADRGVQLNRSSRRSKQDGHPRHLAWTATSATLRHIKVKFKIDADASKQDIEAIVAQSQKRSAVYDVITNPVNVTVEVA